MVDDDQAVATALRAQDGAFLSRRSCPRTARSVIRTATPATSPTKAALTRELEALEGDEDRSGSNRGRG